MGIRRSQQEMNQFPNGTKIFMFAMLVVLFGFFGFMFTAWAELPWLRIIGIFIGVALGGIIGYVVCLKSIIEEKKQGYVHNNTNTLEHTENFVDFDTELRLEELDKKAKRKRLTFQIVMGIWGISLVFAIIFAFATESAYAMAGYIAYFVVNIIVAIATVSIISRTAGNYIPKNAAVAEGIVTGTVLIGGGNTLVHKISVAVLSINKLLTVYIKTPSRQAPYKKGDHVTVEYDSTKPRKGRLK